MIDNVTNFIASFVIGLVFGGLLGYVLGKRKIEVTLQTFAGFSVILIWLLFLLVSIFNQTIQVPSALNVMAGGIVTALFGEGFIAQTLNKSKKK